MTFLGIDQDRIVRQLMPELQRVTTSLQWLVRILACAIITLLVVHIWRLGEDDKRAKEVQSWISAKQFGVSSTPTLVLETERLKRENETLEKIVSEQRETIERQSALNDELKNQITSRVASLARKDSELAVKAEELQTAKNRFGESETCISSIERTLECLICTDPLDRPHALSPCGHVFCLHCLQEWFRKATSNVQGSRNISQCPKSCPCCRTGITQRPIPIFVLRTTINGLSELRARFLGTDYSPEDPSTDTTNDDPWEGIFSMNGSQAISSRKSNRRGRY